MIINIKFDQSKALGIFGLDCAPPMSMGSSNFQFFPSLNIVICIPP